MRRVLLLIASLAAGGCSSDLRLPRAADRLLPDRFGLGVTVDAETGQARTYQANLFWGLR